MFCLREARRTLRVCMHNYHAFVQERGKSALMIPYTYITGDDMLLSGAKMHAGAALTSQLPAQTVHSRAFHKKALSKEP